MAQDKDLSMLRSACTESTQALLLQIDSPKEEFYARLSEFMMAAHTLGNTLIGAVPTVNPELGEAYQEEGSALISYPDFLASALIEHRKRKGIE